MFFGLPDPDPLVRGIDPDPALDPSVADPDPIRNRNKHFGSGFETGSEKNRKKNLIFRLK